MLDKKKSYNENKVVTIIGPGSDFNGEIKSEGTVRIEGDMSGRIQCEDTIVVHDTGRVKADLIGGQVIVSGEVRGNIFAYDRLEITNNGRVIGNICAPKISIAEGVTFEGKCTMKPPGEAKPSLLEKPIVTIQEVKEVKAAKEAS